MNPKMLENFYDDILRGLLSHKINLVGYSSEILNKLFKNKDGIGLDLLSIDILRGRDHGLPSYQKYRKMCNMKTNIKVFDDLYPVIPTSAIIQLRQTYKSVYDIDLIVGGALESISKKKNETKDDEGFFGPTFRCIIGEQFHRLKTGDSFFYSHDKFTSGKFRFRTLKKKIKSLSFQINLKPSNLSPWLIFCVKILISLLCRKIFS
jgi:peroxidase